jgi:hypothetical protein
MQKKKILFLFYRSPLNYDTGNDKRQHLIYSSVNENYETKILTFGNKNSITEEQVIVKLTPSNLKKILNFIIRWQSPRLTHYYSLKFKFLFKEILNSYKPNIIYVEHLLMMQYVLNLNTDAKVIFFIDESNLYVKEKKLRGNFYQKLRNTGLDNLENTACKKADVVLTINEAENNFLRQKGFENVFTIPYGVDTDYFAFRWKKPEENSILFVGDFCHYPNRQAIKTLIENILPELSDFKVTLRIVGRNTNRIENLIQGPVELYDNVPDTRLYYYNSTVFVAPIFTGAGLRVKILEAALCGIPIYFTGTANLGIDLANNEEVILCNTNSQFVSRLKKFFNSEIVDTTNYMRIRTREKIIKNFSLDTIVNKIKDLEYIFN